MRHTTKKLSGAALATTAALMFGFAPIANVAAEEGGVACLGVNACKGQGACATAENACAGQNACKGHGVSKVATEAECTEQGGTLSK